MPPHTHKPRVVVLISTAIVGGPAKGLLQVIPELARRGRFQVVLCTFANRDDPETPFLEACRALGIDVTILRQRFHWDPGPLTVLRALLAPPGSLLQTHGYKEAVFGVILKRLTGCPWIAFRHGTTEENLKVRLYHRVDRWVSRSADTIVAVSRELGARTVGARERAKVAIIENAVAGEVVRDPKAGQGLRARCEARGLVIGCVGRLSPEKGQNVLLDAAARLWRQGLLFTLVFVGDGPKRDALMVQAQEAGIMGSVRFLGQVARMTEVYAALDLLVLPSFKEGMPNAVLEAMQWRLPIVATSVGALPDMLVHGVSALLVRPGDALAMARAIAGLAQDPDKARRMGAKAHAALYPRFSLERRVQRFERLYDRLLESA